MREYAKLYWKQAEEKTAQGYTRFILTAICTLCGKEFDYSEKGVYAASYCKECSEKVRREKNRQRVREYRERKRVE